MSPAKAKPLHSSAADSTEAVEAFMATLDYPHLAEIQSLRRLVLDADPAIAEGIKWNAPSFRASEYFATFNLRQKRGIAVILHLGAKKRDTPVDPASIPDPARLLEWLGPDRALVVFADAAAIESRSSAFQALIREWISRV